MKRATQRKLILEIRNVVPLLRLRAGSSRNVVPLLRLRAGSNSNVVPLLSR